MLRTPSHPAIPVIDIFAGPGGLGEGFSAFQHGGQNPFDIRLSVEKEPVACATLELRKLFRQFDTPPPQFAAFFAGELTRAELFDAFPEQARVAHDRTWQAELGRASRQSVRQRVNRALNQARDWILLGGPPCQAYSIAGRSRMRGRENFEQDERHFLYKEYLQIVADHEPAVFVLENVKGLLSSKHDGSRIVTRIVGDLHAPGKALEIASSAGRYYRLYTLGQRQAVMPWVDEGPRDGEEFLLQAEEYGIPQMRHRILIIGVRSDIPGRIDALERRPEVATESVLHDLPSIRSVLSRQKDTLEDWRNAVNSVRNEEWFNTPESPDIAAAIREMRGVLKRLDTMTNTTPGSRYAEYRGAPKALGEWYRANATGITQHESRAHMRDDLHRYLFCACFARVHGRSPRLRDFPVELYPKHENVPKALRNQMFADRFRVQLPDRPSTTITSHSSKDGHYYIHYDPLQCRSLTVRESARLQTFPDSYFFEGTRTEQYHQVGNAVPPLLARDIAGVVFALLAKAGITG